MKILKALAISFSLYSKIPMPQFGWEDEDMKMSLIFFPWVGAVIMGINYIVFRLSLCAKLPEIVTAMLMCAVPLIVTGGFHVDGFMDVMDALKSYAPRERKLEILKDPHIGAFAVIRLVTGILVYISALTIIIMTGNEKLIIINGIGFVVARGLSGISVIKFKPAKNDGMLKRESEVEGCGVLISLIVEIAVCVFFTLFLNPVYGLLLTISSICCFICYRYKSYREFGGVTGDTAGYFVVVCEGLIAVVIAAVTLFGIS